jgi:hypothetical protein
VSEHIKYKGAIPKKESNKKIKSAECGLDEEWIPEKGLASGRRKNKYLCHKPNLPAESRAIIFII